MDLWPLWNSCRSYEKGERISGLDAAGADEKIFHAGTKEQDGEVVTSGGRVLCVTALGATVEEAQSRAYAVADKVRFEGVFYRKDIGWRALER